jgi:spore coat polysaccharide biosynthesis protein SpsF
MQCYKSKWFEPILVTSDRGTDDPLIDLAVGMNLKYFRGSIDNIYERICGAIKHYGVGYFVRANGDSPFLRAELYDKGLKILLNHNLDFVTNLYPRSFPYGIAVEIFNAKVFCDASAIGSDPFYKEHVTSYFYNNITGYRYSNLSYDNYSTGDEKISLTIDTDADFKKLNRLLILYPNIMNESIQYITNTIKKLEL